MNKEMKNELKRRIESNKDFLGLATMAGVIIGLVFSIVYSILSMIIAFHWLHVAMLIVCLLMILYLRWLMKNTFKKMIKATFKKQNDKFYWYQVEGHANYAEVGNDIVCAGVSSLFITVTNTLLSFGRTFERDGGYFILDSSEKERVCLQVLHDGIQAIADEYPGHVVIADNKEEAMQIAYEVGLVVPREQATVEEVLPIKKGIVLSDFNAG